MQRRLQDIFETCSRRLQNVLKMSSRHTTEDKLVLITRLQDIFKMFSRGLQNFSNRFLRCTTQGKLALLKHLQVNLFDIRKLSELFLEHFMQWIFLQINVLLLKLGIWEHISVLVNEESVNKIISKNVFCRF